jgi:hypothetical protein
MKRVKWLWLAGALAVAACAGYGTIGGNDDDDCSGGQCAPDDGGGGDPGDTPDGGTDPSCERDEDCPSGQVCEDHLCRTPDDDPPDGGTDDPPHECDRDSDCPSGKVCEDHACVPSCDPDDDNDGGNGDGGDGGVPDCNKGPTSCKLGKALLCHVPPGNSAARHSICVGPPSVPAHLAHGDTLGVCAPVQCDEDDD